MKVLIIKIGAMGDVLRTTPLVAGIKKRYKTAEISWLTSLESAPLLKYNNQIKRIFIHKKDTLFLKKLNFDLIINLEERKDTAKLTTELVQGNETLIAGLYYDLKKKKIIPAKKAEYWFKMGLLGSRDKNTLKKVNKKTYQKIIFDLTRIPFKKHEMILNIHEKYNKQAKLFAKKKGISRNSTVIALCPGAGKRWQLKKWNPEKFAELSDKLSQNPKNKVILFGSAEDKKIINQIKHLAKKEVISTNTNNSISQFSALLNLCEVVVSGDTLAMHMGLALKKKVIALFGPTSHTEIEMYGRGEKLTAKLDCICCYKQKCSKKPNCMDSISTRRVFNAVRKMM